MNMVAPSMVARFDYAGLPVDIAHRQQERAERIVALQHRTIEAMGEIGRELLEAQAELEHGTFLDWIRDATGLSKSSAYRFMDMVRAFGPKLPSVGSLPLAVVHKLAEKSTPEPLRDAVLRRIEAGETLKAKVVLDELREAKEAARAAAAAQRQAVAVEQEAARRAALTEEEREQEDALKAKGAKGKAARERRREREQAAQRERQRQEDARVREAATTLIDLIGVDRGAAYFARFHSVGYAVWRAIEEELQRRLAAEIVPTEIRANDIYRDRELWGFIKPEDNPRIEALAASILVNGLVDIPIVVRRSFNLSHPFYVIHGRDEVRALVDVLHYKDITVRIAPSIEASGALPAPQHEEAQP